MNRLRALNHWPRLLLWVSITLVVPPAWVGLNPVAAQAAPDLPPRADLLAAVEEPKQPPAAAPQAQRSKKGRAPVAISHPALERHLSLRQQSRQALEELKAGKGGQAAEGFRAVLSKALEEPNLPERDLEVRLARTGAALALAQAGRDDEFRQTLELLAGAHPDQYRLRYVLARNTSKEGQTVEGLESLLLLATEKENEMRAKAAATALREGVNLALQLNDKGNGQEALRLLERLEQALGGLDGVSPADKAQLLYALAWQTEQTGDLTGAFMAYKRLHRLANKHKLEDADALKQTAGEVAYAAALKAMEPATEVGADQALWLLSESQGLLGENGDLHTAMAYAHHLLGHKKEARRHQKLAEKLSAIPQPGASPQGAVQTTPEPLTSPVPVESVPAEAHPLKAAPMNLKPMESMEPETMEPAPMEPAPMEPEPMEPEPMEPAPMEPSPMEPSPMEPAPMEPAPMEPAPMEPAPMEPAPMEPTPMESLPSQELPGVQ